MVLWWFGVRRHRHACLYAVQAAEQPARLAQSVEALGRLQRLRRLEGDARVDRRVPGLESLERRLGEGHRGHLALADRIARLDERQMPERRGAPLGCDHS